MTPPRLLTKESEAALQNALTVLPREVHDRRGQLRAGIFGDRNDGESLRLRLPKRRRW